MKPELKASIKRFALELVVYSLLVAGYFLLVLHLLGGPLADLYVHERKVYAALALGLIVAQGLVLEILTRVLLSWMGPRRESE
jgi:hypothetical protein